MRDDKGPGAFGIVEALLAVIGAITVMGILAVAASVLAWEMELRKTEEDSPLPEPPQVPTA